MVDNLTFISQEREREGDRISQAREGGRLVSAGSVEGNCRDPRYTNAQHTICSMLLLV